MTSSGSKRKLVAIILAAGKGTRMNSQIPKVLHSICGTAMVDHVLAAIKPLDVSSVYVVTGHLHEQVKKHIGTRAVCVLQKERLGTAHAVKMCKSFLQGFDGDVLVLCGDAPLIKSESLEALVHRRRSHQTACAVLTTILKEPRGYGRIVRNRDDTIRKIVEEKDTNTYEEKINEVNTGTYCFNAKDLAWALDRVSNNNAQKEYYLTDTVEILNDAGKEVEAQVAPDATEVIGVNSRRDMATAEQYLRLRILNQIMDRGVTIIDPSTTYIDNTVQIGIDTTVLPFTMIRGNTVIGEGCAIGPNVTVVDSRMGKSVRIRNSVVEEAGIDDEVSIGPYAYVRPGSVIRQGARVGTFVEVARCDLGKGVDVLHLSYVGDARVGDESYIGAGSITCNFDGTSVNRTEIGNNVFIGSNSLFVAPVRIRDNFQAPHNSLLQNEPSEPEELPGFRPANLDAPGPATRRRKAMEAAKAAARQGNAAKAVSAPRNGKKAAAKPAAPRKKAK